MSDVQVGSVTFGPNPIGHVPVPRQQERMARPAPTTSQPGDKFDRGKPRWDLLPWPAVAEAVAVLTDGAAKYSPDGWQRVPDAKDRYFAALMRHLTAWWSGERTDPETGRHHLAHALCNVLFLWWFDHQGEETRS